MTASLFFVGGGGEIRSPFTEWCTLWLIDYHFRDDEERRPGDDATRGADKPMQSLFISRGADDAVRCGQRRARSRALEMMFDARARRLMSFSVARPVTFYSFAAQKGPPRYGPDGSFCLWDTLALRIPGKIFCVFFAKMCTGK